MFVIIFIIIIIIIVINSMHRLINILLMFRDGMMNTLSHGGLHFKDLYLYVDLWFYFSFFSFRYFHRHSFLSSTSLDSFCLEFDLEKVKMNKDF